MKIAVCGLGESIHELNVNDFDLTIGVNDIWRVVRTNYIVCVDHRERFTPERLAIIDASRPWIFYSHLPEWNKRSDFRLIQLQHDYPNYVCQLDIPALPKSLCSPFIAAAVAYANHDPREIHLFGVDLIDHPNLHESSCKRIVQHFTTFHDALRQRGVGFIVHGRGILAKV